MWGLSGWLGPQNVAESTPENSDTDSSEALKIFCGSWAVIRETLLLCMRHSGHLRREDRQSLSVNSILQAKPNLPAQVNLQVSTEPAGTRVQFQPIGQQEHHRLV